MAAVDDSEWVVGETEDDALAAELIIGLVTPIGTQTGELADRMERTLSRLRLHRSRDKAIGSIAG